MKCRFVNVFIFSLLSLAFSGCATVDWKQSLRFINEDGEIITVDYGVSDTDHKTKFRAPKTGKELEFKSKLRVFVKLPNGDSFDGYECVNELRSGAMYQDSDEEWYYHANGFICTVYHRIGKTRDLEPVFSGVVCQSPQQIRPEQRR